MPMFTNIYCTVLTAILIDLPTMSGKVVQSDCTFGKTYFTRISYMTGLPDCVPCPTISNDKACESDGPSQSQEDIQNCKANCGKSRVWWDN